MSLLWELTNIARGNWPFARGWHVAELCSVDRSRVDWINRNALAHLDASSANKAIRADYAGSLRPCRWVRCRRSRRGTAAEKPGPVRCGKQPTGPGRTFSFFDRVVPNPPGNREKTPPAATPAFLPRPRPPHT